MGRSEIARLRDQIEAECQAMKQDMTGLASGTAAHSFISARLRRIDTCCHQLEHYVGEQEATRLVCELYDQVMEGTKEKS